MPFHGYNPALSVLKKTVYTGLTCLLVTMSLAAQASQDNNSLQQTETAAPEIITAHAIAMHGTPKYPRDFTRFDYTSELAGKGGTLKLHAQGTFDTLNSFVPKGTPPSWLGLIYDTLTVASADEPFTQYGLLAEKIEYPSDRSWVIYHLNPAARFHDGVKVTAEDVVYTFKLLTEKGDPFYSYYYADVTDVKALDNHRVKFFFRPNASHETVLIIGQLAVLPKHYWEQRDFGKASLEQPLGSGPYKVSSVDPGRSITYERVKDYWATNHPVQKGSNNFDRVVVDYYRDGVVALEAFKVGDYDFRLENTSKLWATGYNSDALEQGKIIKREIAHNNPAGMQAYVFNLRKPLFKDRILRQAIGLAFDFEWTNKNLFYGAYQRTNSFFENSDLASSGLPTEKELKILEPFRDQLPESVFNEQYLTPATTGDGKNRKNLRKAKKLLESAGYSINGGKLLTPDAKPVEFEILIFDTTFERIANPFVQSLKTLGINANVRLVDTTQYINRRRSFDFDMTGHVFPQSLSPGNEQRDFWSSDAADTPGSRNIIGVSSPVVDALIEKVIEAKTRDALLTTTHALDRVLLHMHYVIPQWHNNTHRLAYWNKFRQPETSPKYDPIYSVGLMTWWAKSE